MGKGLKENRGLFFLPMIAEALQKPDPKKGLHEAFEEIENLGRQTEYKQGINQYQMFMFEINKNIGVSSRLPEDILLNTMLLDLGLQVIAGVFEQNRDDEQASLDLIKSRLDWENQFKRLCSETEKGKAPDRTTKIIINKDGEYLETIKFSRPTFIKTLRDIKPGLYEFKLETGRILGEETLTKKELLWTYAYPEQDLKLAADTGDTVEQPGKEIEFLNGELILQVFPGLESGRLRVIIGGRDDRT
jgi:hypothetical protein